MSSFSKRMKPNLFNTLSVAPEGKTQRTNYEPSSSKIQRFFPFLNDTLKSHKVAWKCRFWKNRNNSLKCQQSCICYKQTRANDQGSETPTQKLLPSFTLIKSKEKKFHLPYLLFCLTCSFDPISQDYHFETCHNVYY